MEMEVQGTSEYQGMSLVQDANFGFAFMGKYTWTSVPAKLTTVDGPKDGASSVVEFEFGVHFEPDVGPFVKITYKFAKTFTEMFPNAWALVKKTVAAYTEDIPKIKTAVAGADSFAKMAKGVKGFAKPKWEIFKKKLPKIAELLEGFTVDAGMGGKAVGDGFTPSFKFADSGNGGKPVFELEWKPKDANKFTSCCWDIVPPAPAPVLGTCGVTNQGLHAQFQLGGVDYLKAIFEAILPADKKDVTAAPYKVGGKFVPKAIKDGIATNFVLTKAAKVAPKCGQKLAAATMAAGKTIDTIKKAFGTALKSSTCTLRVEFRATIFTVGIENKLETGCWLCKLGGNTGCKRSDGKECA